MCVRTGDTCREVALHVSARASFLSQHLCWKTQRPRHMLWRRKHLRWGRKPVLWRWGHMLSRRRQKRPERGQMSPLSHGIFPPPAFSLGHGCSDRNTPLALAGPRLFGGPAVHALRPVPAVLSQLRPDQAGTPQPARAHLAHARHRGRRPGSHAHVRGISGNLGEKGGDPRFVRQPPPGSHEGATYCCWSTRWSTHLTRISRSKRGGS